MRTKLWRAQESTGSSVQGVRQEAAGVKKSRHETQKARAPQNRMRRQTKRGELIAFGLLHLFLGETQSKQMKRSLCSVVRVEWEINQLTALM